MASVGLLLGQMRQNVIVILDFQGTSVNVSTFEYVLIEIFRKQETRLIFTKMLFFIPTQNHEMCLIAIDNKRALFIAVNNMQTNRTHPVSCQISLELSNNMNCPQRILNETF